MANVHILGVVILLISSICVHGVDALDNGLGKSYDWHSLEDGLKISEETGKPLMLIIHKSWCGACKAFKPKFAASEKALELSKHFVMVNTLDNDEPEDEKYKPDGGYIPRILFLGSDGKVREEIYNEGGNPQYKFYYYDEGSVIKSMSKAVELIPQTNVLSDEL
ncbi:thioredoxin domain-containing protein 12-like [Palaemon carinicauda]|uniref:thioredoxin domain-containing protein 12-like n=1 Tax=Palaemon carinicauda TaxID=392227 RepID=UPI0035B69E2E